MSRFTRLSNGLSIIGTVRSAVAGLPRGNVGVSMAGPAKSEVNPSTLDQSVFSRSKTYVNHEIGVRNYSTNNKINERLISQLVDMVETKDAAGLFAYLIQEPNIENIPKYTFGENLEFSLPGLHDLLHSSHLLRNISQSSQDKEYEKQMKNLRNIYCNATGDSYHKETIRLVPILNLFDSLLKDQNPSDALFKSVIVQKSRGDQDVTGLVKELLKTASIDKETLGFSLNLCSAKSYSEDSDAKLAKLSSLIKEYIDSKNPTRSPSKGGGNPLGGSGPARGK